MIGPLNAVDSALLSNAGSFGLLDSRIQRFNAGAAQVVANSIQAGGAIGGMSARAGLANVQIDALGRGTLNYSNILARLNAQTRTSQFGNADTFLRNQSFLAASHLDLSNAQRRNTSTAQALGNANTRLSGGLQTMVGRLFALSAIATTVTATFAALTRQTIEYADLNVDVNNRLRLVTETEAQHARVRDGLRQISRETRSELFANVTAYSRLALASEDLGRSEEELLSVVEILNQQLIIGGSNAEEARSGVIQLLQGIASNRLQGDELRSVLENLLGVSRGLVMGFQELERQGEISFRVTRGNFRELASEGVLTADLLIRAILASGNATREAFGEVEFGISRSLTNIRTEVTELFDAFENRTGVFEDFADRLESIAEFLGNIGDSPAFQFAAGVSAGGVRLSDAEAGQAAQDFQFEAIQQEGRGFQIDADTFREAAASLRDGVVSNREAAEIFDRFFLDTEEGYIAAAEAIVARAEEIREANNEIEEATAQAVAEYRRLISLSLEARSEALSLVEVDLDSAVERNREAQALREQADAALSGITLNEIGNFVTGLDDVRAAVERLKDELDIGDLILDDRNRPARSFQVPEEISLFFEPAPFSDAAFEFQAFTDQLSQDLSDLVDEITANADRVRTEEEEANQQALSARRDHLNAQLDQVNELIDVEEAALQERGLYILSLEGEEAQLRALNLAYAEELAGQFGASTQVFLDQFAALAVGLDQLAQNDLLQDVAFFGPQAFGLPGTLNVGGDVDALGGVEDEVNNLGVRWESVIGNMVRGLGRLDQGFEELILNVLSQIGAQLTTSAIAGLIPGRQTGGGVAPGQPFIVGEGGPEVFVPSTAGGIFPGVGVGGNTFIIEVSGDNVESNRRMLVQEVIPLIERVSAQQFLDDANRPGTPENRTVRFG